LARRATKVRQEWEDASNLLLLDAGNTLYGNKVPASTTQGKVIVEAMNLLGYDAMTLGAEDLYLGSGALRQRISEAEFPVLSANVVLSETGELLAQPYVIKEVGGRCIAIIGLTSGGVVTGDRFIEIEVGGETVIFQDPAAALDKYLAEVRGQADAVIVLSHLGLEWDQKLADSFEGIALIVGGYPGSIMDAPWRSAKTRTLVVQAGRRGENLGILSMEIDGSGKASSFEGRTVSLTEDFPDDPEMRALLDRYETSS
jgi:2',3'-cyclic-nucleotide 2'-phosphodiesterase (5'-nucleotidase family)